MIRAYSDSYLYDARYRLSQFFDYLINDCGLSADWAMDIFLISGYAERFEKGDPRIISGMSGIELARIVIQKTYKNDKLIKTEPVLKDGSSPEYWAGWVLAEYQWYSAERFKDIISRIKLSEIINMYPVYHEMDTGHFIEELQKRKSQTKKTSNLKKMRECRGLSQSELAKLSGVNLRSIQMYEQGNNDIDKAQGSTIYRLSHVIGCRMEDLLESPMKG